MAEIKILQVGQPAERARDWANQLVTIKQQAFQQGEVTDT